MVYVRRRETRFDHAYARVAFPRSADDASVRLRDRIVVSMTRFFFTSRNEFDSIVNAKSPTHAVHLSLRYDTASRSSWRDGGRCCIIVALILSTHRPSWADDTEQYAAIYKYTRRTRDRLYFFIQGSHLTRPRRKGTSCRVRTRIK